MTRCPSEEQEAPRKEEDCSSSCGSTAEAEILEKEDSSTCWSVSKSSSQDLRQEEALLSTDASEPLLDLEPVMITDLKPFAPEVQSDPEKAALLALVRDLGQECFREDCLEGCSKRGGWRINILAAGLGQGAGVSLLGFVVYRVKPEVHALTVAKLAVPAIYRRKGYGRVLMADLVQQAKSLPEIDVVSLASLQEAITFYHSLGFKRKQAITAKDETVSLVPGQVFMERRVGSGRSGKAPAPGRKRR
eukprot:CAMPEP_0115091958 /NCGR_PEP_ID=MMETSP0227-20121206/26442_1 /TAXON_ID=89957 /ORGANISM="Polarella glacialis, Strain CCMP 1383" /LENGTH=246 /DNA_ID=CAMNT_0002483609 /DNA_START=177 /DNA_END=917 /DNA_ORIENTATION=+